MRKAALAAEAILTLAGAATVLILMDPGGGAAQAEAVWLIALAAVLACVTPHWRR